MAEPYLGEIRLMAFETAPKYWAPCDGQMLPINQNQALFALLGTRFGGNGQTTFALPDYRGRVPIHMGAGRVPGHAGGAEAHTLTLQELPTHTHVLRAASATTGGSSDPTGRYPGGGNNVYSPAQPTTQLAAQSGSAVGGSQAHPNMQPFLTLTFCIAMQGIFPDHG